MLRQVHIRLLVVATLGWAGITHAQTLEGGARAVALAGATTALSAEVWAHANPASWAGCQHPMLSFMVSQAYDLEALRLGAVTYVHPTSPATFALGVRTFGFEDFRETHLWLGLAKAFYPASRRPLRLGLSLRYQHVTLTRYGSAGVVGIWGGLQAEVFPWLALGLAATNVNAPRWAGREALPQTLAIGLAYQPSNRFQLLLDVLQTMRFAPDFRVGIEVWALPVLALRAGSGSLPERFTTGFGIALGALEADIAAEHHAQLGWSPALSLSLRL